MRHRDFFAFSSSLKPSEVKTIGQLSWIRHLNEGDVLYSPGEPGNALYIVNRGMLEVLPPKSRPTSKSVFLTRGDLVGDLEVFGNTPRTQLVRAQEASGLQCFPRANFPELLRLVPSFFKFVCEQMACRVLTERDLPEVKDDNLQLSGRILNFDLTTVHQTITSSGQTGELTIKDANAKEIGAFYFELGRLCAGQFQHLLGEEAFWQLFLVEKLPGTFSFSVGERPLSDWIQSGQIAHNGGELLITALQFRDELDALKKGMPHNSEKLSARTTPLRWDGGAPVHLKPLADQIWEILFRGPKTMSELYRECSVCELKIYEVVTELLYSDQVFFETTADQPGVVVPFIKSDFDAKVGQLSQS